MKLRRVGFLVCAMTAMVAAFALSSDAAQTQGRDGDDDSEDLCSPPSPGVSCGPGNGRRTEGGGEKVPHTGWPAVTGILWKINDNKGRHKVGGPDNDELLGHHGSDQLSGAKGNIL